MTGFKLRSKVDAFAVAEEAAIARAQGLIEWIMDLRGINNKDLSEKLGVSQSAVSQMLGLSPKNLSVRKLARVLAALDDKLVITSAVREEFLACEQRQKLLEMARHFSRQVAKHPYSESELPCNDNGAAKNFAASGAVVRPQSKSPWMQTKTAA